MTRLQRKLRAYNACKIGIEWLGARTIDQAWRQCQNPEHMRWLLWKIEHVSPGSVPALAKLVGAEGDGALGMLMARADADTLRDAFADDVRRWAIAEMLPIRSPKWKARS